MLILQHALLKVAANLLKPIDVTVFAIGEFGSQLFDRLLGWQLVGKHLNLVLDMGLECLSHFIFRARLTLLSLSGLQE